MPVTSSGLSAPQARSATRPVRLTRSRTLGLVLLGLSLLLLIILTLTVWALR